MNVLLGPLADFGLLSAKDAIIMASTVVNGVEAEARTGNSFVAKIS